MNNTKELVSIITANYNAQKFIANTIKSVLAQTYQNWEMIIVDDCSRDDSISIIKEYMKLDERIKLIELKQNFGAAIARNRAIEIANGRFIAFLDSDDLWKSDKLEKQINFMLENKYSFTYTNYNLIDEDSIEYGKTFEAPKYVSYNNLLKTCSIGCLTAIYDTQYLGKVYMPVISKRQDYALWLKILKKIDKAYCLEEPLAMYRTRSNSISSNKLKASIYQWKIYREIEQLSMLKSCYYFMQYAFYGINKYR